MRSVERDNVKMMFDTLHVLYRNDIPTGYGRIMGKDLVYIHVSDSNRLLPGEGRVDWFGLMQTLQKSPFDGYITMEIDLNTRSADPDNIASTALKFLKDAESKLNSERKG